MVVALLWEPAGQRLVAWSAFGAMLAYGASWILPGTYRSWCVVRIHGPVSFENLAMQVGQRRMIEEPVVRSHLQVTKGVSPTSL